MSNINQKVKVLSTLQASGADVVAANGLLNIKGFENILVSNIQSGSYQAGFVGYPAVYTATATITASATYTATLIQRSVDNQYVFSFSFTNGSSTDAATFYAAIEDILQRAIDGGQLLGSVSSSASGTVLTASVDAPIIEFEVSGFSIATASTALDESGSSCTNAAPRVLTVGSAHGLTTGKLYQLTISGVTGTGAADLNRTLFVIPASSTTLTLLGTTATGTVTTTSATITVANSAFEDFEEEAGLITGYSTANSYVAIGVNALSLDPVEAGSVIPYLVLADATNNTVANVNAFINALRTALASTPAAIG